MKALNKITDGQTFVEVLKSMKAQWLWLRGRLSWSLFYIQTLFFLRTSSKPSLFAIFIKKKKNIISFDDYIVILFMCAIPSISEMHLLLPIVSCFLSKTWRPIKMRENARQICRILQGQSSHFHLRTSIRINNLCTYNHTYIHL